MCSRSFFYFLLFSFSASLSSLDHCRNVLTDVFLVFDTLTPASGSHVFVFFFLDDIFLLLLFLLIFSFSASLLSKYSSKFRLSSSPDDRISFESRSAAILEMLQLSRKKGCIEPVFGKTADRKTIMDYHARDQTEKTIINYHVEFDHVQTA